MTYISNTQRTSEKAVANGYASLGSDTKVPPTQLGGSGADGTKFLCGDQTWTVIATVAAESVSTQAFGDSAAPGSASTYSKGDHKHAMMGDPVPTHASATATHGATGAIVGTTNTQTLSAKTLTTPIVNGVQVTTVTKTFADTGYVATTTDYVILVNCAGGHTTIVLPAVATSTGQLYKIKKIDSDITKNLVIDGNSSETIDGETTKTISAQNESVTIVCDGAAWYIV